MKRFVLALLLALAFVGTWWWLREDEGQAVELVLARERAAAHYDGGELSEARAALAPLLARRVPALEDLERSAAIEFMDRGRSDPAPAFERLRARDPENPALHYMLARLALETGEFERAREHFESVRRARADDLATRVGLAATLADLGLSAEARELLAGVLALGVEHAGSWYVQAVYRASQLAQREGTEEAQRLTDLFQQLRNLGYRSATAQELDRGTLAGVRPPPPGGVVGEEPGVLPSFAAEAVILPELAGARELHALDLDGDRDVDFLTAGERGLVGAFRGADGHSVETILPGPVERVRAFDLGNSDALDLLACRGTELVLLEHVSGADVLLRGARGRWTRSPLELPALPSPPRDLVLVDFDHDGDLDLLLAGAFGARLLRNDGAAPRIQPDGKVERGRFADVTAEAGLPIGVELFWCATEDLDADHDVDLLLGGPGALFLMDNLRAGKFVDAAGRVLARVAPMAREPLVADLDGDARADLFEPGAPSRAWMQQADGTFLSGSSRWVVAAGAEPVALDLDLDGTLDVLWASPTAAAEGALGFGTSVERAVAIPGTPARVLPLAFADLDHDLDLDLARITEQGLEIQRCKGPVGHAARLEPIGLKDNRRAVGALVEVRTRGLYRRIYWRGEAQLVGCGAHPAIDVVRITWPNGGVQTRLDVAPVEQPFLDTKSGHLEQSESLIGSCPFLYTWNGTTFEFVSDVLGGTPLGLPIGPGELVPPDHDEYVLVRGDQLVARDGRLELQLTEELREVTYLDRIRLDVLDHPLGSEVHPNERFTFPPFPEPYVHALRAPLAPLRATGSDGADWTQALAAIDDVHARPFQPLEPQFLGLATPHWLELEFDPVRLRDARRLRLLCTGWFFWTDASVNMASARTPGVRFVPPTLQVPAPEGEWLDAGPPLGFPAGKSKTMVIELEGPALEALRGEHPRLRLFSTLRLYWDSIRLATDADDAPLSVTALEPLGAELWARGFSRPIATGREDLPERFEWDALSEHKRWNPHPGRYTRYGETLPLVEHIDDRFVILGSGDALRVHFDASALPPLADGWTRDYLVFLDGWAKDRDPNTLEALSVEPLPFHGMSAYPYGPDEHFPDGAEHAAWRAEWNTREGRGWIPPLAPRREAEWARELARGR